MKKIYLPILCATALMCSSYEASAQEDITMPPPPSVEHHADFQKMEKHHEKMATKLAEKLNLNEEQKEKAQEMRKAARQKMKPLLEQMKELRKKMDTLRQDNMKEFENILTPEQKEIFAKIKEERKAKFEKMMKKHHHGHHHMAPLPME